jgi:hypothetical protein
VRGSTTIHRDRKVSIHSEEQIALLKFVARYAQREGTALFRGLGNFNGRLPIACRRAGIAPATARDFQRAAGQWLLDQGIPVEVVGEFMRYSSLIVTREAFGLVQRRGESHAGHGSARRAPSTPTKKPVTPIRSIPAPKTILYAVGEIEKTLSEWARHSGVSTSTLLARLRRGVPMHDAIRDDASTRARWGLRRLRSWSGTPIGRQAQPPQKAMPIDAASPAPPSGSSGRQNRHRPRLAEAAPGAGSRRSRRRTS